MTPRILPTAFLSLLILTGLVQRVLAQTVPSRDVSVATFIFVRHAEKNSGAGDVSLNEKGKSRARQLAGLLGHTGVTHIFTSEMSRTRETAEPLAEHLGVEPTIVPAADQAALLAQLAKLPNKSVALIVTHSNLLTGVIEKLGAQSPTPIEENEFDRLFIVSSASGVISPVVELRYGN